MLQGPDLNKEVKVLVAGGEVAGEGGKRLVQRLPSRHLETKDLVCGNQNSQGIIKYFAGSKMNKLQKLEDALF